MVGVLHLPFLLMGYLFVLVGISISTDPENLMAITTLAAMGTLLADEGLLDAALSEILSMPLNRRHELDPTRDVDSLLLRHHLSQVLYVINQLSVAFILIPLIVL